MHVSNEIEDALNVNMHSIKIDMQLGNKSKNEKKKTPELPVLILTLAR